MKNYITRPKSGKHTLIKLHHELRPSIWSRVKIYFVSRRAMNQEFARAHRAALDLYYEAEAFRIENERLRRALNDPEEYLKALRDNGILGRMLSDVKKERDNWKRVYEEMHAEWDNLVQRLTYTKSGGWMWRGEKND